MAKKKARKTTSRKTRGGATAVEYAVVPGTALIAINLNVPAEMLKNLPIIQGES